MKRSNPPFLDLCPAEPFRIFFPLATLIGISGVSLWPLFFSGMHKFYPGIMHARMMIEGFLAGFILGFLGTALPRLLSAPALRRWELWPLVGLYLTATGLHIGHQSRAGDWVFILLMLGFGACMLARWRYRQDSLPPGFILVAFGLLCGLIGPILWLGGLYGWFSSTVTLFGGIVLNQGFALFPLLGVGTFLFPRILGLREPDSEQEAARGWWMRASLAFATGLAIFGSFWLDAAQVGAPAAAASLRLVAAASFLGMMIPFQRKTTRLGTANIAIHLGLIALLFGISSPLFWPIQRLAGLHIVFLGGFSLITFTVATRVILGHSGNESLFETRLPALQIAVVLLLIGSGLRAFGDFVPTRSHWLDASSYLWMCAAGVWGFGMLPKVRVAEPQE